MTTETEKLATIVETLQKNRAYQRGAWAQAVEIGRKYAQMKLHGSYLERGNTVSVCFSDLAPMEEQFKAELLRQVERAFLEDALMGAALAEAT